MSWDDRTVKKIRAQLEANVYRSLARARTALIWSVALNVFLLAAIVQAARGAGWLAW